MDGNSFFIYVFSEEDKIKMINKGFKFLNQNEATGASVFLNEGVNGTPNANNEIAKDFSANNIKFALSDTLTF